MIKSKIIPIDLYNLLVDNRQYNTKILSNCFNIEESNIISDDHQLFSLFCGSFNDNYQCDAGCFVRIINLDLPAYKYAFCVEIFNKKEDRRHKPNLIYKKDNVKIDSRYYSVSLEMDKIHFISNVFGTPEYPTIKFMYKEGI